MLLNPKTPISALAVTLFILLSSSLWAQEAADLTKQDSTKSVIRQQVDQIVDDVLNKIDRMMERYWKTEEELERDDSVYREETAAISTESRYEERYNEGRRRYRSNIRPIGAHYPLHWSARVTELDPFLFRYNRVEGVFLGLGSPKRYYWNGQQEFSVYGSVGYGFKTRRWQYSLGADRWFFNRHRFEIGIEGHSIVDTKDEWFIGTGENTLAALFMRQDYHDYFRKDGFSIHAAQYLTEIARLRVDYAADEYRSLPRNTEWAFFGGNRRFRLNSPVDGGKMTSVIVSVDVNNETERRGRTKGWNIHASTEFSGGELGGDFIFNRYLLEIRRAQPLSRYDKLSLRVRVGSSQGTLPLQKIYEIGGIGTLNAYSYKQFSGNRMILGNIEYQLSGSALNELSFWPDWLFDHTTFIIFADAGMTNVVSPNKSFLDGFEKISGNQWKSDIGIALGSRDGATRLAFAWRTDARAPVKILLRIERPF